MGDRSEAIGRGSLRGEAKALGMLDRVGGIGVRCDPDEGKGTNDTGTDAIDCSL